MSMDFTDDINLECAACGRDNLHSLPLGLAKPGCKHDIYLKCVCGKTHVYGLRLRHSNKRTGSAKIVAYVNGCKLKPLPWM